VFVEPDTRFLGYGDQTDPRTPKKFGFLQPLILPTERKKFYFETNLGPQWKDFWDVLWKELQKTCIAAKELCCVDTAWWLLMKERTTCCSTRSVHQLISRSVAVATLNGLFGSSRLLAELHVLPNLFSLGTGLNNTRSGSKG
jgi:hypothetical protein